MEDRTTYVEWGVYFPLTGETVVCDSEVEARSMAETKRGRLVARTVYETTWQHGPSANDP
jgi:hypothetical protein